MPETEALDSVRAFNRFYTARIGVLEEGLLDSPYSLTEARVLYELASRAPVMAAELARDLGLDPGYLSRLLKKFIAQGLLNRQKSPEDARQYLLSLTTAGREVFAPLEIKSRAKVAELLAPLSPPDRSKLLAALKTVETLLTPGAEAGPVILRPHRPGDLGWVVQRQTLLYAHEYGWDGSFEAMVAEIAARFIANFQPGKEACWMAERDGDILGSVMLVENAPGIAQLRMLYVEARARGLGVGTKLVAACDDFARQAGYRAIRLWTNANLLSARRLYEAAGYRLIESEPYQGFGQSLVGETWEKTL